MMSNFYAGVLCAIGTGFNLGLLMAAWSEGYRRKWVYIALAMVQFVLSVTTFQMFFEGR